MSASGEKSSFVGPVFSRKKSLLSMQQYATSQGVSTGVVQECAKLGVVQVRKHKDKTYIVDLPLDIYKGISQQDEQKPEPLDTAAQAERISNLMSKILQPPKHSQPLPPEPPITIPDLHLFAQEENKTTAESVQAAEPQLGRFRISLARKNIDAVRIVSVWRIVSVVATVALFVSISAYWMVSIDRNIHKERLQQSYSNIQKLMDEYGNTRQKARLYELDMLNWQSEAQRNQKSVANLQIELQQTREKLFQARRDLADTQKYHAETLKLLNEQINEIGTRSQQNAGGK
ncbi:MAG: hypothetical protein PHQ00_05565 [Phycisphaerae bacterium]|nr:hypothetical protein [Phycisphaerae bacterium]